MFLPAEPRQIEPGGELLFPVAGDEFPVKSFLVPTGVLSEMERGIQHNERSEKNVEPAQERCEKPVHARTIGANPRPASRTKGRLGQRQFFVP